MIPWMVLAQPAHGHQGPPFPIITDRQSGPYNITVWTHPDVGVGTFYVILEAKPGTTLPHENKVEICVQPVSGRLPEVCYTAELQGLHNRVQHYCEVEFDRQEMWKVRVRVSSAGKTGEVTAEVEPTPPGFGPWDLLLYGFPFVLFGLLWFYAALRQRKWRQSNSRREQNLHIPTINPAR
jgi:hypothetical protein